MPYGTVNADVIQSSVSGVSLGAGNASAMKNRIINGAMVIDQRAAGASSSASTINSVVYVSVDRWGYVASQANKFTLQQNAGSVTPPVGFVNYLGITSSSAYTVGSSEFFLLRHNIEGYNTADLGWGTANAKTVTLSFWVYSSLTGTFGGALGNSANNRTYPFSYSIPVANTWTQISITVPGDTTGTWLTTNGIGLKVTFGLGMGSTYSGTAGAWAAAEYYSSTGAVSVLGTNGATFYVTGVQLEVGSSATGFEYRQYGTELALCQRYFEKSFAIDVAPANNLANAPSRMVATSFTNTSINQTIWFKVNKRAAPTITTYSPSAVAGPTYWAAYIGGWSQGILNGITAHTDSFDIDFNVSVSTTVNGSYITSGFYTASAEL